MLTFLVIGVLATLLLILDFIFEDIFGWFIINVLNEKVTSEVFLSFIATFGYSAFGFYFYTPWDIPMSLATAFGFAIVGGLLMKGLMLYIDSFGSSSILDNAVIGEEATVIVHIPAGGYGKVSLLVNKKITEAPAMSNESLCVGKKVIVENIVTMGTLKVTEKV